jgi:hypothetical protein
MIFPAVLKEGNKMKKWPERKARDCPESLFSDLRGTEKSVATALRRGLLVV